MLEIGAIVLGIATITVQAITLKELVCISTRTQKAILTM